MSHSFINPFYLVETKKTKVEKDINKIFGIPKGISKEKWPKRERHYMNHLITIDVRKLTLPLLKKADIITLFFYFGKEDKKDTAKPFEAIYFEYSDAYLKTPVNHPEEYNALWNDYADPDLITNGIYYRQKEIKDITVKQIHEAIGHEEAELSEPLKKLRGTNSFIGGVPLWLQAPETPKTKEGSETFFLFMLNGFADYTKSTVFEGFDLFLFLDNAGNVYGVAQS